MLPRVGGFQCFLPAARMPLNYVSYSMVWLFQSQRTSGHFCKISELISIRQRLFLDITQTYHSIVSSSETSVHMTWIQKIAAGVAVAKWSTFTHGTWSTCYKSSSPMDLDPPPPPLPGPPPAKAKAEGQEASW